MSRKEGSNELLDHPVPLRPRPHPTQSSQGAQLQNHEALEEVAQHLNPVLTTWNTEVRQQRDGLHLLRAEKPPDSQPFIPQHPIDQKAHPSLVPAMKAKPMPLLAEKTVAHTLKVCRISDRKISLESTLDSN